MGRLFCTESGRMLLYANEEIARWRWARKRLMLPKNAGSGSADLWICLMRYPESLEPLRIGVNERQTITIRAEHCPAGSWCWHRVKIPAGVLRGGANEIIVSCDSTAMDAWMLGIETGHRGPSSFLSTDRGRNWRNERMGACGMLRGEYLVRLRLNDSGVGEPSRWPAVIYEDRKHPRVSELARVVPKRIRGISDEWRKLLALRTWVAEAWTYEAFGRVYAPWDPWTVLSWKRDGRRGNWGHGQANPIAMCVHYGMVFASLAASLGYVARGMAVTEDVNGPRGHFLAEVWSGRHGKWVAHDPNFDLHYEDQAPLSGVELADRAMAGESFVKTVRPGAGFTSRSPRLRTFLRDYLRTGKSFRNMGIWRLNNVISEPGNAPPSHGSVIYAETDFIWYTPKRSRAMEMFPHRCSQAKWFTDAPKGQTAESRR